MKRSFFYGVFIALSSPGILKMQYTAQRLCSIKKAHSGERALVAPPRELAEEEAWKRAWLSKYLCSIILLTMVSRRWSQRHITAPANQKSL